LFIKHKCYTNKECVWLCCHVLSEWNVWKITNDLEALREKKEENKKNLRVSGTWENINLYVSAYSYVSLYLLFLPLRSNSLYCICLVRVIESETSKQPSHRSKRR
jgi:hypothetical protein